MKELEEYLKTKFKIEDLKQSHPIQMLEVYLRFELGDGLANGTIERVNQATERGIKIFENIFINKTDEIWLLIHDWGEYEFLGKTPNFLYQQIQEKESLIKQVIETEEEGTFEQLFIKSKLENINYKKILKGISKREMGFSPYVTQLIYFIEPQKEIIFYMYDDRGCLIHSNKAEKINHLLLKFNSWIVDFDRQKINKIFNIIE